MSPGQAVAPALTSVAVLGALAGGVAVPLGIAVHRWTLSANGDSADTVVTLRLLQVYPAPVVASLAVSGVVIAVVGGLLPALRAARAGGQTALRTE